jgi:hypothetical protein
MAEDFVAPNPDRPRLHRSAQISSILFFTGDAIIVISA